MLRDARGVGDGRTEDERRAHAAALEGDVAAPDTPAHGRAARRRRRGARAIGVDSLVPVEGEHDGLPPGRVAVEAGPSAAPTLADAVEPGNAEDGEERADVELAERVLARAAELPERSRQRDRDGRLAPEKRVDMEDLLGRLGESTERGEDRAPAAEVLQRRDEPEASSVRE